MPRGKPCSSRGRSRGKEYCPAATHSVAAGRFAANAPAKSLCSMASVGSRTCFTSPWVRVRVNVRVRVRVEG